ncbi:MAG: hypothetical protein GXO19_02085 [Epsilonproteobacteria bacterium]|nr:hypothetical protein [Campylobacterota bacterium]NPA56506.1 hypothetical protein [Campylobacterota bacterium]
MASGRELSDILRITPAVSVRDRDGVETTISLQWFYENGEAVQLLGYTLLISYRDGGREELYFPTYDEMMEQLQEYLTELRQLKK